MPQNTLPLCHSRRITITLILMDNYTTDTQILVHNFIILPAASIVPQGINQCIIPKIALFSDCSHRHYNIKERGGFRRGTEERYQ